MPSLRASSQHSRRSSCTARTGTREMKRERPCPNTSKCGTIECDGIRRSVTRVRCSTNSSTSLERKQPKPSVR